MGLKFYKLLKLLFNIIFFLKFYYFRYLVFDKNTFPVTNVRADEYSVKCGESSVNHIFEKILNLKDLMMTDSGKKESESRHQIVVDMLYHLFSEEDVPEWTKYLDQYLNVKNKSE